jgi:hypothetical protein
MEPYTVSVLETDRLAIRRMSADDAGFMLALLNASSWLRFRSVQYHCNLRQDIEIPSSCKGDEHGVSQSMLCAV